MDLDIHLKVPCLKDFAIIEQKINKLKQLFLEEGFSSAEV